MALPAVTARFTETPPQKDARLRCPKCGEPVVRQGQYRGVPRYRHAGMHSTRRRARGLCDWNGTNPVGIESDQAAGLPRAEIERLHSKIARASGVQRYVITAAQNATPIHKRFFASLLTYCRIRKAQLVVIPYRYKNPTSFWSKEAETEDWWAPSLARYLLDRRIDLNTHLTLLADIKTQPTASSPLAGFETLAGAKSAIIGHPKLELTTVATPQQKLPKILTTTGAVTRPNYIPSKAGKKGEFHHTFGACVVEIDGGTFHLRQINALADGSFCDLDREYRCTRTRQAKAEALVMGDSHIKFIDPAVAKATFDGRASIVGRLKPKTLVWNDVLDFYTRNHHHRGRVFINYVKHHNGHDNVEQEIDETCAFVDRVTPPDAHNVFVFSNHPDALRVWVEESDPRQDPENCVFWARTFEAMCDGSRWTDTGARTIDPFAFWALRKLKTAQQAKFLAPDESHLIKGVEVGYHGHRGPDGARGTRGAFGKVGVKTVIGHSHSPGIKDGVYQVGTSSRLGLEYVQGPSSWLHTHCVIYRNGKRSLINIVEGKWRA